MRRKALILPLLLLSVVLIACNGQPSATDPAPLVSDTSINHSTPSDTYESVETSEATIQETAPLGPPKDEYTEIILHDDRYFLCKKVQSGFSENGVYYGIYDTLNSVWALEYAQYDTHDIDSIEFNYHGNGVFSYKYSWYYGTMVFLSADLGYSFETEKVYNIETVRFIDGRAIALLHDEPSQTYINGMIAPDIRLVWIDTYGSISDVNVPGFVSDDLLYWYESVLTGESDLEKIYANCFYNYNTGKKQYYIFIYNFEDGTTTLIRDQEYSSRLQIYVGDSSSNSDITIHGDIIRIDKLEGDDGELYYAEFDKDGNLVTPATLMK